jgi:hypothetical protein
MMISWLIIKPDFQIHMEKMLVGEFYFRENTSQKMAKLLKIRYWVILINVNYQID